MNLAEKIEQLQNKPEAERKKILIVSLIIGMALIAGIWTATIKNRLRIPAPENNTQGPWNILWNDASDTISSLKNNMTTAWRTLINEKMGGNSTPQESDLIYQKNQ
ncbi:MAG: hypothetical protein HZC14_00365 [Candidatus Niyogibacteria bacterium]|nr:hypothetical protein [Candidatus Niyogibacteria bacterium]